MAAAGREISRTGAGMAETAGFFAGGRFTFRRRYNTIE